MLRIYCWPFRQEQIVALCPFILIRIVRQLRGRRKWKGLLHVNLFIKTKARQWLRYGSGPKLQQVEEGAKMLGYSINCVALVAALRQ